MFKKERKTSNQKKEKSKGLIFYVFRSHFAFCSQKIIFLPFLRNKINRILKEPKNETKGKRIRWRNKYNRGANDSGKVKKSSKTEKDPKLWYLLLVNV